MTKLTPAEVAAKHAKNLKNATSEITMGVNRVTEAPGVKAAAKAEKMKQNLVKSIDDGVWQERVASVTLPDWKDKMLTKGIPRIAQGVDASLPKTTDFHAQLQDAQAKIDAKLEKMPDLSLEDGINRAMTQIREMAKFKKK